MRAALLDLLPALIALCGIAAITWGCYILHPAAGFIVGGILLCGGAYLIDRAINEG